MVSQIALGATCRGRDRAAVVRGARRGAVVLAALALVGCSNGPGGSSATPSSTTSPRTATIPAQTSPSPTTSASTDPATAAKAAYANYRRAVDRAYADPSVATREQLAKVSTGGTLTFLLRQVQALSRDKVHQKGTVPAKSVKVTSVTAASGTRLAQAFLTSCLDFSQRTYVNADGTPRFSGGQGLGGPNRAMVNMIFVKGAWLVADEQLTRVKAC